MDKPANFTLKLNNVNTNDDKEKDNILIHEDVEGIKDAINGMKKAMI